MPTVTLAQLRKRVYDGLDENFGFFPALQVTGALNEGLYRLNLIVGFSQDTIPVPGFTQPLQYLYSTPPGILIPMRAYCEGRELQKLSLNDLAQNCQNWTRDTNAAKGPVSRWATIGLRQFVINPADAVGGRFLEVQGITNFVPLVGDNQAVSLEDPWVDLIVDYTKTRLLLKDSSQTFATSSTTYQEWVRKLKTMVIWAGMRWPSYYILKVLNPAEKNEKVA